MLLLLCPIGPQSTFYTGRAVPSGAALPSHFSTPSFAAADRSASPDLANRGPEWGAVCGSQGVTVQIPVRLGWNDDFALRVRGFDEFESSQRANQDEIIKLARRGVRIHNVAAAGRLANGTIETGASRFRWRPAEKQWRVPPFFPTGKRFFAYILDSNGNEIRVRRIIDAWIR